MLEKMKYNLLDCGNLKAEHFHVSSSVVLCLDSQLHLGLIDAKIYFKNQRRKIPIFAVIVAPLQYFE